MSFQLDVFRGGQTEGLGQGGCSRCSLWGLGQEDGSVEYNEALSGEQASGGAAALQAGGAEGSIPWDERSKESREFVPAQETPRVTASPKKGLISLACKKVGSGFLI